MTITLNFLRLACGWLAGTAMVQAAQGEMTLHGTLIDPPACTINDGHRVDVNFGERLGINRIDGVNYRQRLNYQITCESNNHGWFLTLSLDGIMPEWDPEALQTSKENLGIRVYQNGKPFTPKSMLKVDLKSPPYLEAVPVSRAGAKLTEGAFEAWATLRADYQ